MSVRIYKMLIWVLSIFCLINVSLGFDPIDNYLIDSGSSTNKSVGDRVFLADDYYDSNTTLSTPENISVNSSLKSITSSIDSALYETARILVGTSTYTFSIKKHGFHFIRLYFFPLVNENYNLSTAKFSVSAQNFTLLRDFQPQNVPAVKEYSLNISSNNLVLTFTPSTNSFAFLNALEVFSLPDELIPSSVGFFIPPRDNYNMWTRALETVWRVNMGNTTVSPQNDTLWRSWVSDGRFLKQSNIVKFVSEIGAVNYTGGRVSEDIAPPSVYGTATRLNIKRDPDILVNMTWSFDVDPGFDYLVRFHFCDIAGQGNIYFNLYTNSLLVASDIDLVNLTSNISGAPYYMDVVANLGNARNLVVSIGPSILHNAYPDGTLNGVEIMKMSNSRGSLDVLDSEIESLTPRSKVKVWVIAVSVGGALFLVGVVALVLFIACKKRRRRAHVGHSTHEHFEGRSFQGENADGSAVISRSKIWYRFRFAAVQEATNNFSESGVIGVGGFGKVYKGVLKDNTKVAVKRGASHSQQGVAEFRTEIEMLSQFRHRHLVSLIGYCDEKNEMIIIYEYMENGTLKNHLYGSDLPKLNWRQRLEICIGSARGLHYLHTGYSNAIIHRDVKSANILLNENLMAKFADFGLSKNGPEIDQTHVSTAVKGSFGYLDPEYLTTQQLTEKSDVYSFGAVLLEILCGRAIIDPSLSREMVNLVEWAMKCWKCREVKNIVDPYIVDEIKPGSLNKFCETVEKCLAECGADRPTMGDVLWNLECTLQLQGNNERSRQNSRNPTNNDFEASVSTMQFSVGSAGDLAGVSMSRVFSQMVKAEINEVNV